MGISASTVGRLRRVMQVDPSTIFWCNALIRDFEDDRRVWNCRICGKTLRSSERRAREHAVRHVLPKEAIARGVMQKPGRMNGWGALNYENGITGVLRANGA